jgi:TRAP-type transport system large permease protein
MMIAAGHAPERAAGLIAGSGVIAPVLPPSIGLIIFGVTANVSITKLFMAGIVPGLLMGLSLWITWAIVARKEGLTPPPRRPLRELLVTLWRCAWALMLPVIILVGLRMGMFTPTEAGVVAAVYALFVATVIYRSLKLSQLYGIFKTAGKTTGVVMFLVAAAMVSSWLITVADLPSKVVGMLEPFLDSPTMLMVAIMVLVMIVGTAMDMTPTILILTPVLMPVVIAGKIDPVYFGVLFIMNNAIGLVTPPVGVVLNVVAGVGRMSMDKVTKGVMPFMTAQFIIMFLMVLFPWLVTGPAKLFHSSP